MAKINVLLWNMWEHNFCRTDRLNWFINNILPENHGILLLLQVSNNIVVDLTKELKNHGYYYKVSNLTGRKKFEIIASKRELLNWKFQEFSNTEQFKGMTWVYINTPLGKILIACCELEENNPKKQIGQIKCIIDFMNTKSDKWLFGCNTNFPNETFIVEMNDAWAHDRNKYCYYTLDTERNTNLSEIGMYNEKSRPLRLYMSDNLYSENFILKGTEKCNDYFPSIHFGITADIITLKTRD